MRAWTGDVAVNHRDLGHAVLDMTDAVDLASHDVTGKEEAGRLLHADALWSPCSNDVTGLQGEDRRQIRTDRALWRQQLDCCETLRDIVIADPFA